MLSLGQKMSKNVSILDPNLKICILISVDWIYTQGQLVCVLKLSCCRYTFIFVIALAKH